MSDRLRVAVLVKQVPVLADLRLGADGRLQRDGLELELNAYCRRAVAKGVELARATGGRCVAVTLGPPSAADALREAVVWGADEGILVTDAAFAGSDTLATARALAAVLGREGPFDLILVGRNSVDADTGQVGPQLAELIDLPFVGPVRALELTGRTVRARCERDDGYAELRVELPAVLSAAERLCAPAKVPPAARAGAAGERIRTVTAADLGPGPWGAAGSPTSVGRTRALHIARRREIGTGPVAEQVHRAAQLLATGGILAPPANGIADNGVTPALSGVSARHVAEQGRSHLNGRQPCVGVLAEPGRERSTRELLGAAARLAGSLGGRAALLACEPVDPAEGWAWGADDVIQLRAAALPEDAAAGTLSWCGAQPPWALLAPSSTWGREAAARIAASLGAGLTGDAVELDLHDGRLVCWKPAFGGALLAAVTASSATQLATVRPGALPLPPRRPGGRTARSHAIDVAARSRIAVLDTVRDDDPDVLALARTVVGVGQGVDPASYPDLKPLLELLGAKLGATRKVTDLGWLPRSRQIGITGRSIAPDLYVAIAVQGKLTHLAGVRGARFVLAINADPAAPIFTGADFGIVGDWREVVPLLVRELAHASPLEPAR